MKIVLISSGVLPCPPPGYGGLEQVVYDLAVALDNLGHQVLVIAPSESTFPGNITRFDAGPCSPNAAEWEQKAFDLYKPMLVSDGFKDAVIHDHTWRKMVYLLKMERPELNLMSTLHGMLPYQKAPDIPRPCMAGISKFHADTISAGLGIATRFVYNGIDLDRYPYIPDRAVSDRFLFLARMTPFKGAHVFLDLMRQMQTKGDLVGDDTMVEDKEYVARLLQGCNDYTGVRYWGGVSRERAAELFRQARAYILPCTKGWEEPFGLTVVEAMASGTPVIATASGAIPELIQEGVTGYVAKFGADLRGLMTDEKLQAIKPEDCRKRAEEFSRENMAVNYLTLYNEVLQGGW